jgi:hypothetical protein
MIKRFAPAVLAAGLLGAIAASPAHADLKVTWHMTMDSPQTRSMPEQSRSMIESFMNPMTIYTDGKHTKMDTPMIGSIVDKPNNKVISIMKMMKTYSVSTLDAAHPAGMPMPGAGALGGVQPADVTVTPTGKTKTILSHQCHELIVAGKIAQQQGPNMTFKDDMWVATDLAGMSSSLSSMPFGSFGSASSKVDGFPLEMDITLTGGQMDGTTVTMTTTDISTDTLPAGTFDIPAGYTKSEGGLGGMMGGPGGMHRPGM